MFVTLQFWRNVQNLEQEAGTKGSEHKKSLDDLYQCCFEQGQSMVDFLPYRGALICFQELGAPALAAITGNIARKQVLLFGLFLVVLMNLLAAAMPNSPVSFVTRFFSAIGAALYTLIASTVAAASAPAEKSGQALTPAIAGLDPGSLHTDNWQISGWDPSHNGHQAS